MLTINVITKNDLDYTLNIRMRMVLKYRPGRYEFLLVLFPTRMQFSKKFEIGLPDGRKILGFKIFEKLIK